MNLSLHTSSPIMTSFGLWWSSGLTFDNPQRQGKSLEFHLLCWKESSILTHWLPCIFATLSSKKKRSSDISVRNSFPSFRLLGDWFLVQKCMYSSYFFPENVHSFQTSLFLGNISVLCFSHTFSTTSVLQLAYFAISKFGRTLADAFRCNYVENSRLLLLHGISPKGGSSCEIFKAIRDPG